MNFYRSSLKRIEESEEFELGRDEGLERRSPSLLQFSQSISALNSLSLGVQVNQLI